MSIPPRARLTGALLLVSSLLACNDGGSSSLTRGSACRTAAAAQCLKTLDCNLGFTDAELCTQLLVDRCCGDAETCEDGVSADDLAAFRRCESDLAAQACDRAGSPPASCAALTPATE